MIEMQKKIVNFAPMISIDRHISRLIASNDCVIVPGFGAFLSHRIPAHYNAEEQIFILLKTDGGSCFRAVGFACWTVFLKPLSGPPVMCGYVTKSLVG